MGIGARGVTYKKLDERMIASIRQPAAGRPEIRELLAELVKSVPAEIRDGDFFWINHYINSLGSGFDVEVGVPVKQIVANGRVASRRLPALQVLAVLHEGPAESIRESFKKIGAATSEMGLISEEFMLESFPEIDCVVDGPIEVQFVLHDWAGLFKKHLARVVGEEAAETIYGEMAAITIDTPLETRHRLTLEAVKRLAKESDQFDTYDVVSSCAHVFPDSQTAKLNHAYQEVVAEGGNKIEAIDAVLAFMESDTGWQGEIYRDGEVIYTAKNPRDPAAYEAAETDAERRKAYCFCLLIRSHLEEDIPPEFCYCGAGWYRKQWEDATGKPVSIEIVRSLTKGDDRCQYAITIMD
jgi:effector-binding domain-containing protein